MSSLPNTDVALAPVIKAHWFSCSFANIKSSLASTNEWEKESDPFELFGIKWAIRVSFVGTVGFYLYRMNNWDSKRYRYNFALFSGQSDSCSLIELRQFLPNPELDRDNWGCSRCDLSIVRQHLEPDGSLVLRVVIQQVEVGPNTVPITAGAVQGRVTSTHPSSAVLARLARFARHDSSSGPDVCDIVIICCTVAAESVKSERPTKRARASNVDGKGGSLDCDEDLDGRKTVGACRLLLANVSPVFEAMFFGSVPSVERSTGKLDLSGHVWAVPCVVRALVDHTFGVHRNQWDIRMAADAANLFALALHFQIDTLAADAADLFTLLLTASSSPPREMLPVASAVLRFTRPFLTSSVQKGGSTSVSGFGTGMLVMAPWGAKMYPAEILDCKDGKALVCFTQDGRTETVESSGLQLALTFADLLECKTNGTSFYHSTPLEEQQRALAERMAAPARKFLTAHIDLLAASLPDTPSL